MGFLDILTGKQPDQYERGGIVPLVRDIRTKRLQAGVPSALMDLMRAAMTPGDVYQGNVSMYGADGRVSPEIIKRSADLAGGMTLGAGAVPAQANSLRAGIKNPLIVQHNLSPEKLKFADELGGMPMPSLAISRADHPLENFGDITLIGSSDMATPGAKNRVWPNDAYTGRQPRGELQFKDKKAVGRELERRFPNIKDAAWFFDRYNGLDDADYAFRQIEDAVAAGLDVSQFKTMSQLQDGVRQFRNYAAPTMDTPGVAGLGETQRVLPQGFTYSGNRKKPKPYTLENVLADMRKEQAGAAASEGFHYGASSFRAAASRPFRSLSDIKNSRDKIVSPGEMDGVKNQFSEEYSAVVDKILQDAGLGHGNQHTAESYLADLAAGRDTGWFGGRLPPETKAEAMDFARRSRNLPTEYFEVKPQRAVGIGEFKAAIVPESAEQAKAILGKHNVPEILSYGTPEQRRQLIADLKKYQFALGGLVAAGVITQQQAAKMQAQGDI